mmetsp:Transcript_27447/g.44052  ORF Transcript_27447/g.44052 Transcript_27447/m.44052 type:complete len:1541 (-) Transcript_27447:208-4830(-)
MYVPGQAVQVYSKTSGAWVDAFITEMCPDGCIKVRYGSLQKLIPAELQPTTLRQKASSSTNAQFWIGQAVQVYSKSSNAWVTAVVREVFQDGSIHVQYTHSQNLYKVVPPELQATMVREADTSANAANTLVSSSRVAELKEESQRLNAVLAAESERLRTSEEEHQKQLVSSVPADHKAVATAKETSPEQAHGCWKCGVCTFENIDDLSECELCGARKGEASVSPSGCGNAQQPTPPTSTSPITRSDNEDLWRCLDCTFDNLMSSLRCKMCGSSRDVVENEAAMTKANDNHAEQSASQEFLKQMTSMPARPKGASHFEVSRAAPEPPIINAKLCLNSSSHQDKVCPQLPRQDLVPQRPPPDVVDVPISGSSASSSSSSIPHLKLSRKLHDQLRPYQREGISWMWQLYCGKAGGILGDDMGLGKTVQACGLIEATRLIGRMHALVIVPVTLIDQWSNEIRKWCPDCPVYVYHGSSSHRARAIRAAMRRNGGVVLTSYSIAKSEDPRLLEVSISESCYDDGTWFGKHPSDDRKNGVDSAHKKAWDVVICDEAHVMRSVSTLVGKALRKIHSTCRVLLTGTPIQNALQDLWSLMDFAQPGLLGNHSTFVKRFNDPIEKGSVRGAAASAVALKKHLCEQLWQLIKPHMLRRTKDCLEGTSVMAQPLPLKTEVVIWLHPSKDQMRTYKKVLETSDVVHEANSKTKLGIEVFRAIGLMKRLCNHPALGLPVGKPGVWHEFLSTCSKGLMDLSKLRTAEPSPRRPRKRHCKEAASASTAPATVTDQPAEPEPDGFGEDIEAGKVVERMLQGLKRDVDSIIDQSAKLRCLAALLPALNSRGHRTLIFSQGLKMMDLVEICILRRQGIKYLRIDGLTDTATRAERVHLFESEPQNYSCMLLTTRVGGYGLNLTGADRVIILDPAWNPATDMQAVDRAHRLGQEREVKTYRLIMSGLIEDKMFRLQVFKMGLTKTALDSAQQHRYFTSQEIRGLFEWTDPAVGETRRLLKDKHADVEFDAQNCDGANEGWFKAGPAVGLSNFSALYSSLASEEADALDDCSPEVRSMKATIAAADKKVQQAAEARVAAECRLTSVQEDLEKAAQQISDAAETRSKTNEAVKQCQAELSQTKRTEVALQRKSEKVEQQLADARENQARMNESRQKNEEGVALTKVQVSQTAESLVVAGQGFVKALDDVSSRLASVSSSRSGTTSVGIAVGASASSLNSSLKLYDKVRKTWQNAEAAYIALNKSFEETIDADATVFKCEADVAISTKHQNFPGCASIKEAQAALKNAEREHTRIEKMYEKDSEREVGANDSLGGMMSEFKEQIGSLADVLYALDEKTLQRDVKVVQQGLKNSVRALATSFQTVKAACDSRSKINTLYRKAAKATCLALGSYREAQARLATSAEEHNIVSKELAACKEKLSLCERRFDESKAALAEAEEQLLGQKRKRDEDKAALSELRQSMKALKTGEKDATSGRESIYKSYAKNDKSVKEELKAAKASARAYTDEQHKAIEAIQALKNEAYDPNQVQEAYESKKRPQQEDDV